MDKIARYLFLCGIIGWASWILFPTYKWYKILPEADKKLIGMSAEELAISPKETRSYVRYLKSLRSKVLSLGLDLQGGVFVTVTADEDDLRDKLLNQYDLDEEKVNNNFNKEKEKALTRILQIIKNRIDAFGVAEPAIRSTFDGKITIELPGVSDPNLLKEGLSKVGKLEFRFVNETFLKILSNQGIPVNGHYGVIDRNAIPKVINLPTNTDWVSFWENDDTEVPQLKGWYPLYKRVDLDGSAIKSAAPQNDNMGRTIVSFELTDEGGDIFADITKKNILKQFAIVLDNKVRSAPVIQGEIRGGRAQISGSFGLTEATYLANILEAGALPVRLKIVEERLIGPQLGIDSIQKGLQALTFGTIAVVIFMICWYRLSGFIASIALSINIYLLVSILASLGATLTLSGIAGIALTVGMAVDANIILFERIKEELSSSKNFIASFHKAYDQAGATIWDSNLTTIVAAVALSIFGSGSIKGFGITLAFGIISNIFTSLFVSKLLLETFMGKKRIKILGL